MEDNEYPWPQEGDTPFVEDGDTIETARLVLSRAGWCDYAKSYKWAADLIAHRIINCPHADNVRDLSESPDMLVYPVVFMYRHYLELCMKLLIGYDYISRRAVPIPREHKLELLWGRCRPILEEIWPGKQCKDLDVIERSISQFPRVDPGSTAFRYPPASTDEQAFGQLKSVNLRDLSQVIDGIDAFFDAVDAMPTAWMDGQDNAQFPLAVEDDEDVSSPYWPGDW